MGRCLSTPPMISWPLPSTYNRPNLEEGEGWGCLFPDPSQQNPQLYFQSICNSSSAVSKSPSPSPGGLLTHLPTWTSVLLQFVVHRTGRRVTVKPQVRLQHSWAENPATWCGAKANSPAAAQQALRGRQPLTSLQQQLLLPSATWLWPSHGGLTAELPVHHHVVGCVFISSPSILWSCFFIPGAFQPGKPGGSLNNLVRP